MAHALPIPEATRGMKPPDDWNEERDGVCHTLDIIDRDGVMISAWTFTPDELKRMAEGKPLYLHIHGTSHPVVGLSVGE